MKSEKLIKCLRNCIIQINTVEDGHGHADELEDVLNECGLTVERIPGEFGYIELFIH